MGSQSQLKLLHKNSLTAFFFIKRHAPFFITIAFPSFKSPTDSSILA
ncbi:hypothetical protein BGS_0234 [Beggiatoa sp. SS]|nr:hypothetical protein BGS_0234 [Beggiatoa sp. SS]